MRGLTKRLALASALAAVVALTAGSGTASAQQIPGCIEATNVQNIIDDSGSMSGNDPIEGRRQLVEILADLNRDMTFGGVEFGANAAQIFAPVAASAGEATYAGGLAFINADGSGVGGDDGFATDYNDGFAVGNLANPNANARMFLSDGDHNVMDYLNGHRGAPFVKTYVVGFGSPTISSEGQALLNLISTETGGPFHVVNSSGDVLKVALRLHAQFNCQQPPVERTLTFKPTGLAGASNLALAQAAKKKKSRGKKVAFKPEGNTSQVVLSWDTQGTRLKAAGAKQGKKGARRTATKGDNYLTLNFRGLKKGKVRFRVVPKLVTAPTLATVQIVP
jgi:hypothetical protein